MIGDGKFQIEPPPPPKEAEEKHEVYQYEVDSLLVDTSAVAYANKTRVTRPSSFEFTLELDEEGGGDINWLDFEPKLMFTRSGKVAAAEMAPMNHPYKNLCDLYVRTMTEKDRRGEVNKIRLMMNRGEIDPNFAVVLMQTAGWIRAVRWAARVGFTEDIREFYKWREINYQAGMENLERVYGQMVMNISEVGQVEGSKVQGWNMICNSILSDILVRLDSGSGITDPVTFPDGTVFQNIGDQVMRGELPIEELELPISQIRPTALLSGTGSAAMDKYIQIVDHIRNTMFLDDSRGTGWGGSDHGDYDRENAERAYVDKIAEAADRMHKIPLDRMKIEVLPQLVLNPKKRRGRTTVRLSEGTNISARMLSRAVVTNSTANLFVRRQFDKTIRGGTVIIDSSGSMGLTEEHIVQLIRAAPGASVAYYSSYHGRGVSGGRLDGILYVAAVEGKMSRLVNKGAIPTGGGGNEVDYQALRWMMNMPRPWYFVTDRAFCGGHPNQAAACAKVVNTLEKRKLITVLHSLDEAMQFFKDLD